MPAFKILRGFLKKSLFFLLAGLWFCLPLLASESPLSEAAAQVEEAAPSELIIPAEKKPAMPALPSEEGEMLSALNEVALPREGSAAPPVSSAASDEPTPLAEEEETLSVYQTLLSSKSLLTSPQFLVVDDFSRSEPVNYRGGVWHFDTERAQKAKLQRVKEDARNLQRGFSLRLYYRFLPYEKAVLKSSLEKLDISKAEFL